MRIKTEVNEETLEEAEVSIYKERLCVYSCNVASERRRRTIYYDQDDRQSNTMMMMTLVESQDKIAQSLQICILNFTLIKNTFCFSFFTYSVIVFFFGNGTSTGESCPNR